MNWAWDVLTKNRLSIDCHSRISFSLAYLSLCVGNWSELLKRQITSLALNVSVVWLGSHYLERKVSEDEANDRPVLFHSWEPNLLSMSDRFGRIAFPECRFKCASKVQLYFRIKLLLQFL